MQHARRVAPADIRDDERKEPDLVEERRGKKAGKWRSPFGKKRGGRSRGKGGAYFGGERRGREAHLAPVRAQRVGRSAQVVPGDLAVHVVRHVHVDVVAQELHPAAAAAAAHTASALPCCPSWSQRSGRASAPSPPALTCAVSNGCRQPTEAIPDNYKPGCIAMRVRMGGEAKHAPARAVSARGDAHSLQKQRHACKGRDAMQVAG